MSYRACYAVISAWQRVHKLRASVGEWTLLLWLCRQTDDKTLTVIRSQDRLGEELGVSGRQIRTYMKVWKSRGVLRVLEHGGGHGRKPAKYAIDLTALEVFLLKQVDLAAAEVMDFRSRGESGPCGSPSISGEDEATSEAQELPKLNSIEKTSGVGSQLRKSEPCFDDNSGTPGTSASSEFIEEKIRGGTPAKKSAAGAHSLARLPSAARSRADRLDESNPGIRGRRQELKALVRRLEAEKNRS